MATTLMTDTKPISRDEIGTAIAQAIAAIFRQHKGNPAGLERALDEAQENGLRISLRGLSYVVQIEGLRQHIHPNQGAPAA